jgi:serine protease Do
MADVEQEAKVTERGLAKQTSSSPSWLSRIKSGQFGEKTKNLSVALLIIVSLASGFLGGWLGAENQNESSSGLDKNIQQVVVNQSQLINQIVQNVGPSVVSVNVISSSTQTDFFGFNSPVQQESAGTGIIISKDGYVLTNRHVIPEGVTQVSVTLSDGTELTDVKVVGRTSASDSLDIAILKVNDAKGKELKPAVLADSSKVKVGERVVAIGNALGQFQNTVTEGIISGYGRSVQAGDPTSNTTETLQNLFQTDAAINQGNSGGPLVNMNGEVIGVNTAIAADSQNIGFAIPINDTKGLISSVLRDGKFERPYLGVRYVTLTDDYAYQYNLEQKRGAYIAPSQGQPSVLPGSPADKAGLKEKDIITKVDGVAIDEAHSLTSLIGQHAVGEEVTLTVLRDGKEMEIKVTLEAAPQE